MTSIIKKIGVRTPRSEDGSALVIAIGSIAAFSVIFLLASSSLNVKYSLTASAAVLGIYLFFVLQTFRSCTQDRDADVSDFEVQKATEVFNEDLENKLQSLEDASTFFGASLKPSDMFRLVSSRVNEMVPFRSIALFLADESENELKLVFSEGKDSETLTSRNFRANDGLAGKVLAARAPKIDKEFPIDKFATGAADLEGTVSSLAAPLFRGETLIGVIQLFGDEKSYSDSSLKLIEAIGVRLSPLLLTSLAFEQNLSSALTDPLTNLPNERAFYLVLENQIAESQRNRDERPLTVLALDIKNFAEINRMFGHSTGDNILAFSGKTIKNQLRKMDFLARSANDEFLIVLPTANDEKAQEILERLVHTFDGSPFPVAGDSKVIVQLNSGAATFYRDGETAVDLLERSRRRKRETKSAGSVKILPFRQK